jgi:hypothetical protein
MFIRINSAPHLAASIAALFPITATTPVILYLSIDILVKKFNLVIQKARVIWGLSEYWIPAFAGMTVGP